MLRITGVERLARRRVHGSAPTTSRSASFIGLAAVTGGDVTIDGRRARRPGPDPARASRGSASSVEIDGTTRPRPAGPGARRSSDDLGGADPEDRGRPVARVPGRPDLDRASTVATQARGHGPDLREDVREPPVLHRQARLDGRADHPLRPAPRGRHRPGAAVRPAHVEPGHPRRHGDAARGALRRGHVDDRQRRARSTAATSGSTSGCARSAPASSARAT